MADQIVVFAAAENNYYVAAVAAENNCFSVLFVAFGNSDLKAGAEVGSNVGIVGNCSVVLPNERAAGKYSF